jgi:pilus biogenesis lipoprotein CpaD
MNLFKISATLLVLLAGCAPEVSDWTPAESPKVNKVDRAVFTHTINYPAHASGMNPKEKKCLFKFLKTTVLSPGAVTVILEEHGGHSEKRIKDIERELLKFGIPYELITVYDIEECQTKSKSRCFPEKGGSYVELTLERYVIIPPACADFSEQAGNARQERTGSNFGCSVVTNLGMNVANPRDLVRGRPLGDSDGTVIAAGIMRYRTDQTKPLLDASTTSVPGASTSSGTTGAATAGSY